MVLLSKCAGFRLIFWDNMVLKAPVPVKLTLDNVSCTLDLTPPLQLELGLAAVLTPALAAVQIPGSSGEFHATHIDYMNMRMQPALPHPVAGTFEFTPPSEDFVLELRPAA